MGAHLRLARSGALRCNEVHAFVPGEWHGACNPWGRRGGGRTVLTRDGRGAVLATSHSSQRSHEETTTKMENDKYFSIYAFTILGALAAVVTTTIQAGYTTLPSFWVFAEHIAMSLCVRAAYKSFGWDWGFWTFGIGERPALEGVGADQAAPAADEKIAA